MRACYFAFCMDTRGYIAERRPASPGAPGLRRRVSGAC